MNDSLFFHFDSKDANLYCMNAPDTITCTTIAFWTIPHMAPDSVMQNKPGMETSSTPILDCLQPPPTPLRFSGDMKLSLKQTVGVLFLLFCVVALIPVVMTFSSTAERILDEPWVIFGRDSGFLITVLILVIALHLAIGIHELGHLFAGWIAGFEFSTMRVGPVVVFCTGEKTKLRLCRSFLGGRIIMFPRLLDRLRWRFFMFIAGGPLANFVAFLWFIWIPASIALPAEMVSLLTWSAWISLIMGFSNLLPFETNDLISDGGRIRMLLSKDGRKERWFALTNIENELRSARDPKIWPSTLIQIATALEDRSTDCLRANYYAFIWAGTLNRVLEAACFLERSLKNSDKAPAELRKAIFEEAAIFQAWHRQNADTAREWIRRAARKKPLLLRDLRLHIVLLWADNKTSEAIAKWEEGLKVVRAISDPRQRDLMESSWLEWKQEMEARLASVHTPL